MNDFAGSNLTWANQTTLHPFGFAAILLLGSLMLLVPRGWAVLPMLIMACFVAPAQRIVVFTLDFNLLRVMIVFGWLRMIVRSEYAGFRFRPIDWVMIAWAVAGTVCYTILVGDGSALINQLGGKYEALGMYFLFRCLVRSWDDLYRMTLGFVLLSVPVAIFFIIERSTGHNLFGFLGGVPEITVVREGQLRCQGAFAHPILAGCFWASAMPFMGALWWWRSARARAACVTGLVASGIIILTCASSTPILSVLLGLLAASCILVRGYMRPIRWGILGLVCLLHIVMKQPVWHLISRFDVSRGSTGWYRFNLIDQTVKHFGDWWLIGTLDTPKWSQGLGDITNQFVLEGITGGLLTLVLFIAVISLGFGAVGRLWRSARGNTQTLAMAWALGVALFIHMTNFLAVSYFGQIVMVWYLVLAVIVSLDAAIKPIPVSGGRKIKHRLRRREMRPLDSQLIPTT